MKVAVCLSGQPRFFKEGFKYFEKAFVDVDVDFFIHSWYDESEIGVDLSHAAPEGQTPTGWKVTANADIELIDLFCPKKYLIEKQKTFTPAQDFQSRSKTWQKPEVFMSMLYSRKKVGKLLVDYVKESGVKYDWVIFTRTDVAIQRPVLNQLLAANPNLEYLTAHVPGDGWNREFMNDSVVASSFENMVYWSILFDHYEEYWLSGVPYCLHRMLYHHLQKKSKSLKDFLAPQGIGWSYIRSGGLRNH